MKTLLKSAKISRFTSYLIKFSLLFTTYFITAVIGLKLNAVSGFATLIWVPTGLSLASLLLFGYEIWPAIFLGSFLANWQNGAMPQTAIFIAGGNSVEAVLGYYILRNYLDFRLSLTRLKDALSLIYVSIFVTLISATTGVTSLYIAKLVTSSKYFETWSAWWVGDLISNLVITPIFLLITQTEIPKISKKLSLHSALINLFIVIIGFALFFGFFKWNGIDFPVTYIIFPPLILAALKFGQPGAVISTFIITITATVGTLNGLGPFAIGDNFQNLFFLESFMVVVAVTSLVLGAVESERKDLENRRNNFISIASHEFKTPITTISSYSQLLQSVFAKNKKSKAYVYLTQIQTQSERLTSLINNLLDVSKIQTNKMELNRESFAFDSFIRQIVRDMKKTAGHRIIIEGSLNKEIWADKTKLYQVITNLLSNSIKFSPKSKSIKVKVIPTSKHIKVSIQDYGDGISKENQEKVFEKLYQEDKPNRPSFGGLGLGLYISKEIIKLHRGKIWITSKKGFGTISSFRIPLRKKG